jgi:hypothetical protein
VEEFISTSAFVYRGQGERENDTLCNFENLTEGVHFKETKMKYGSTVFFGNQVKHNFNGELVLPIMIIEIRKEIGVGESCLYRSVTMAYRELVSDLCEEAGEELFDHTSLPNVVHLRGRAKHGLCGRHHTDMIPTCATDGFRDNKDKMARLFYALHKTTHALIVEHAIGSRWRAARLLGTTAGSNPVHRRERR